MKKFDVKMLAIWLIAVILFVVLVFLLPLNRNAVFGISFAVTLISFGLVALAYILSFMHDQTLQSKLLGFPIFRVSVLALGVQLIIGFALMALSSLCPLWLAVAIECVLLAGSAVCLIGTEAARGVVEKTEVVLRDHTQAMKQIRALASAKLSLEKDPQVYAACQSLVDAIRYADPVSNEATAEMEQQLEQLISGLGEGEPNTRLALIEQAQSLLQQRNAMAKISK